MPPDPDLERLHTRTYEVRSFRVDAKTVLLVGAVRDIKPAGLYVQGDPEPLVIHHMVVNLEVTYPSMEITSARVVFEDHPHTICPGITPHYEKLIGLSIARGFTHRVRELFGGPRGCTHVTALLQAMAPVANQSRFSMSMAAGRSSPVELRGPLTPDQRKLLFAGNVNTCHVWDEEGDHVQSLDRGEESELPLWIQKRFAELGRDASDWRSSMSPGQQ